MLFVYFLYMDYLKTTNSSLVINVGVENYFTNQRFHSANIYANSYTIPLSNKIYGGFIDHNISIPTNHAAWIDMSDSYIVGTYNSYPLTYTDYTQDNVISAYLDRGNGKIIIQLKGDWSSYNAWIVVKHYDYPQK